VESDSLKYFKRQGQTIFAPATALGGPVVILRISGSDLREFEKILGPLPAPNTFSYRSLKVPNSEEILDRALVLYFKAPHSFSGEDVLELQVHGVEANVERLSEILQKLGGKLALPGEFSFRAVMNERMTLLEAEGLQRAFSVEGIRSEVAAGLLGISKEFQQSLNEKLLRALKALATARGRVEAAIDFSEAVQEQEEDLKSANQQIVEARNELTKLLGTHEGFGRNLGELRVAIVGRPNVGKSTLLNILAGGDRALVSPEAGTTRDVLDLRLRAPDGNFYRFLDTAGMRLDAENSVEIMGIERGIDWASQAHILIRVRRANEAAWELDPRLQTLPSIDIFSFKDELSEPLVGTWDLRNDSASIYIEVFTKLEQLRKSLQGTSLRDGDLVSARQTRLIRSALNEIRLAEGAVLGDRPLELAGDHLRLAEEALRGARGEGLTDEYIGEIFSQFCLGK
jgi:tRNA modification GTPase